MAKDRAKGEAAGAPQKGGGRKKLVLLAVPVLLLGAGAGLWFGGLLPGGRHEVAMAGPAHATTFFDMPEIVANLNAPGRRASYIKLRSKLELARPDDLATMQQVMPRLMDLFTTYLREIRPEELRGSAGTQRLREELMARANIAFGANRVTDVLFQEILVQ